MPYIKQQLRKKFKTGLEALFEAGIKDKGELNYLITCLMIGFALSKGIGYNNLSEAKAAANDAADEFNRRALNLHENIKTRENGDVYEKLIKAIKDREHAHLKVIPEKF